MAKKRAPGLAMAGRDDGRYYTVKGVEDVQSQLKDMVNRGSLSISKAKSLFNIYSSAYIKGARESIRLVKSSIGK